MNLSTIFWRFVEKIYRFFKTRISLISVTFPDQKYSFHSFQSTKFLLFVQIFLNFSQSTVNTFPKVSFTKLLILLWQQCFLLAIHSRLWIYALTAGWCVVLRQCLHWQGGGVQYPHSGKALPSHFILSVTIFPFPFVPFPLLKSTSLPFLSYACPILPRVRTSCSYRITLLSLWHYAPCSWQWLT